LSKSQPADISKIKAALSPFTSQGIEGDGERKGTLERKGIYRGDRALSSFRKEKIAGEKKAEAQRWSAGKYLII